MLTRRKDKCYNGGKLHNYQPRYSEKPFSKVDIGASLCVTPMQARTLMVYQVYECDVCIWCGNVVDRFNLRRGKTTGFIK